ncbi:MAG: hypothetical protein WB987_14510 [Candidatus Acidiferrales bacterium]
MRKSFEHRLTALLLGVLVAAFTTQARPQSAPAGTVPITTVVTALGKNFTPPPALSKDDVSVREGQVRREVLNWTPAQGDKAGVELAIVVDDTLRKTFGSQLQELSAFITSQPRSTSVGVFYASNGTVQVASQFNPDLEAVAKTVRIPTGTYGAASSIYHSLMQLIGGWPVTGARREILLFSDGFDYLRRERFSPDVPATIETAQRAGVVIHAIFESVVGRPGFNRYVINAGQGNLNQITDGTGGYAFFSGDQAPLSISPYTNHLSVILKNQYFLTFATNRSKNDKGDFRGIKVLTERRDVELKAADKVFVPGGEK